jgi:hypothetical protein
MNGRYQSTGTGVEPTCGRMQDPGPEDHHTAPGEWADKKHRLHQLPRCRVDPPFWSQARGSSDRRRSQ